MLACGSGFGVSGSASCAASADRCRSRMRTMAGGALRTACRFAALVWWGRPFREIPGTPPGADPRLTRVPHRLRYNGWSAPGGTALASRGECGTGHVGVAGPLTHAGPSVRINSLLRLQYLSQSGSIGRIEKVHEALTTPRGRAAQACWAGQSMQCVARGS